jgi:hypothetical protein
MLHVNDGSVVLLDAVCFGPPEAFFAGEPYKSSSRILIKGEAFR